MVWVLPNELTKMTDSSHSPVSPAAENAAYLGQAIGLLDGMDQGLYRQHLAEAYDACIGGHFRHVLEHYATFADGLANGRINYDSRPRDMRLEEDPAFAADTARRLQALMDRFPAAQIDDEVEVWIDTSCDPHQGDGCFGRSTIRRELYFLLSHTVHHFALISIMCRMQGLIPAADFGVAPSTLRHQRATAPQAATG